MISCKLKKLFNMTAEPSFLEKLDFTVNVTDGKTPKVAKFLKEHPDYVDMQDGTALDDAVRKEHKDMIRLLLDAGADINRQNEWGGTVLLNASVMKQTSMMEYLLEQGADINIKSRRGANPLFNAALHEDFNMVEMMLGYNPSRQLVAETIQQTAGANLPQMAAFLEQWQKDQDKLAIEQQIAEEARLAAEEVRLKAEFLAETDCSKPLARVFAVPRKLLPIRAEKARTS